MLMSSKHRIYHISFWSKTNKHPSSWSSTFQSFKAYFFASPPPSQHVRIFGFKSHGNETNAMWPSWSWHLRCYSTFKTWSGHANPKGTRIMQWIGKHLSYPNCLMNNTSMWCDWLQFRSSWFREPLKTGKFEKGIYVYLYLLQKRAFDVSMIALSKLQQLHLDCNISMQTFPFFLQNVLFFSCPEQLNRWPCH